MPLFPRNNVCTSKAGGISAALCDSSPVANRNVVTATMLIATVAANVPSQNGRQIGCRPRQPARALNQARSFSGNRERPETSCKPGLGQAGARGASRSNHSKRRPGKVRPRWRFRTATAAADALQLLRVAHAAAVAAVGGRRGGGGGRSRGGGG